MKFDKKLSVRCSAPLDRAIDKWAKQNHVKPAEMVRIVLEKAFGIEGEMKLPPGLGDFKMPAQDAPGLKTT